MFPQDEPNSELKRDHLLESTLGYWSSAPRETRKHDPFAWEEERPLLATRAKWVWLVVVILIMLAGAMLTVF